MSEPAHFGFTKLVVQDLGAMANFYRNVAGLVEMARVQDAVGDRKIDEILFNATGQGGATFVLFKFLDREAPAQEEVILGFQTPDVVAFVDRVKSNGGTVVTDVETKAENGVKVAFVADPEGHLIEVVELLQA
jgi:Lactoylglutathione lyase and related lyases